MQPTKSGNQATAEAKMAFWRVLARAVPELTGQLCVRPIQQYALTIYFHAANMLLLRSGEVDVDSPRLLAVLVVGGDRTADQTHAAR